MSRLNGILLVDKSEGCSSAEVVRVVKKRLAVDKIGHIGTLDPFATGLLPLCLGTGTKVAQFLTMQRKTYTGTIRLGIETETLDATGTIIRTAAVPPCESEILQELQQRFSGEYWQIPPMYSALKRQGVPLYKLARDGVIVEREARKVEIEEFTLVHTGADTLSFSLSCSKGTYIRSLAADLGTALGCGAHLVTLRRTACGRFTVSEALPFALLSEWVTRDTLPVLSPAQALRDYQAIGVSGETAERLRHGQQEALRDLPRAGSEGETVRLLSSVDEELDEGELIAIAEWRQEQWRLVRVF